jgi:hypothetical protein
MSLSCTPLDIHGRDSDKKLTYTWPHTDMSFVSQIPADREIYAFEKLSSEYLWKIKMSLFSKPLDLHWRDSDMTMTYTLPQSDIRFVSRIPTDREIYAFEKLSFENPWKIKMSLSSKPFYLLWRDSDTTMTYTLPQSDISCFSQIATDREIYACEFNFAIEKPPGEVPWHMSTCRSDNTDIFGGCVT